MTERREKRRGRGRSIKVGRSNAKGRRILMELSERQE